MMFSIGDRVITLIDIKSISGLMYDAGTEGMLVMPITSIKGRWIVKINSPDFAVVAPFAPSYDFIDIDQKELWK